MGQGSTFWFNVPLLKTKAMVEAPVYNTDITNEKILIVDDNETNRELMKQLHDHWEIPHTLVDSARSAVAELTLAALEKKTLHYCDSRYAYAGYQWLRSL